jgi:hypothetical protein
MLHTQGIPMVSFWQTLLSFFFRNNTPEAVKKRALKAIVKQIQLTKNNKFYQPKTGELTPACAKFFYHVYKTVSLAQAAVPPVIKSEGLRHSIVEYYLGKEILEKFNVFFPENIAERAENTDPERLAEDLRQEFDSLSGAVDPAAGEQIDSCYTLILVLGQFVSFDFYVLLKRFGALNAEYDFTTVPRFTSCHARLVINMIQDFVDYIAATDPSGDWETALSFLKNSRTGKPLIPVERWKGLLFQFQEILDSRIFQLIIQHITGNTEWKTSPQIPEGYIFSDWLESKRQKMEDAIAAVAVSQWNSEINKLSQGIFGNIPIISLKFYNEKNAGLFADKGFKGFLYVDGLGYLMTFLRHVFAKDMQEFGDLLIVRAHWSGVYNSASFSGAWNNMRSLAMWLENFDDSLGEGSKRTLRLFGALDRVDRDRYQGRVITELLDAIDAEAMEILQQALNYLTNIAQILESVRNDYFQNPHMLILNWRDLETASGQNMAAWQKRISIRLEKFIGLSRLLLRQ